MRGGGSRVTVARKTASSRRRRDRYTQDRLRSPWGDGKRVLWVVEDDDDDDTGIRASCRD